CQIRVVAWSILPMADFEADGSVFAGLLFHHDEAPRAHFVRQFLIDVLLDNGLAQLLAQGLEFLARLAVAGDAKRSLAAGVTRKSHRHAAPGDDDPLVAAQLAG